MTRKKIDIVIKEHRGFQIRFDVKVDEKIINVDGFNILKKDSIKDLTTAVLDADGQHGLPLVEKYKEFNRLYDVTPTTFKKMLNAVVFNTLVKENKDLIDKYAVRKGRGRQYRKIYMINKLAPILRQAQADNQHNLLPVILESAKTPSEIRKEIGKGAWKKLCKFSHHRNQIIYRNKHEYEYHHVYPLFEDRINYKTSHLQVFDKFDYPNLKVFEQLKDALNHVSAASVLRLLKQPGSARMIVDTYVLADLFDEKPSHDILFSVQRLAEIHNGYVARYNANRNQCNTKRNEFNLDKMYPDSFTHETAQAKLIKTYDALQEEGKKMHHCVGSYSSQVKNGTYVVYHLTDGEEEATLGIAKRNNEWVFNQCYSYCNESIKSQKISDLADVIVTSLNKGK